MERCLFRFVFKLFFSPKHHMHNIFLIIFSPICISFFFNWIVIQLFELNLVELEFDSIWFKFQSMYLNWIELNWIELLNLNSNSVRRELNWIEWISIQVKSKCMQCHSIFSFKWNLIFTKSICYFHQLIKSSLIAHNNAEPKLRNFDC
jgi:hypothetical protein